MKTILLAITVSLMVPAYADPTLEACQELKDASDKMSSLIEASKGKEPLDDAGKAEMKQGLDNFDKAMRDFYEIDQKVAKKKRSKFKALGQGIVSYWNSRHTCTGGYYPSYAAPVSSLPGLGMPVMNPVLINGQPGTVTQMGMFTNYTGPAFSRF